MLNCICSLYNHAYLQTFFIFLMLHPVPRFVDFTVIGSNETAVNVSWILESPGVAAAGQMRFLEEITVRWVQAAESLVITSANLVSLDPDSLAFPPENIVPLSFDSENPPTSGMQFNETFVNLMAGNRYIVRIDGTNSFGTSTTFFAFDTSELDMVTMTINSHAVWCIILSYRQWAISCQSS